MNTREIKREIATQIVVGMISNPSQPVKIKNKKQMIRDAFLIADLIQEEHIERTQREREMRS
jgi:hypothetical protein